MSDLLSEDGPLLRGWVLITGLAGLGAAIGAYSKPLSPHMTLYKKVPETANAVFARMYATWLLTSTCVRVAFFLSSTRGPDTTIFWLVFATYCIALWHFGLEIFVFKTAGIRPGGIGPLIVASGSIAWFLAIVGGLL